MKRERVEDILRGKVPVGAEVEVAGWVRTLRESKAGVAFLHMTDGSTVPALQVIVGPSLDNFASEIRRLSPGCSIIAQGRLIASQGKGQAVEVEATSIRVVGWVDDPETYPIQPKRHTPEFLREVAHLRVRTNLIGAVARVRNSLAQAIHRYFHSRNFYWVHTPIVTSSDAEGAGAMFRVSTLDMANPPRLENGSVDFGQDFFGRQTSLTVSGQLNVECYCLALSKVYSFGPTFRAENSNTRRHLAEFWMIEPEVAFTDLAGNADLASDFLKVTLREVLNERDEEMKLFAQHVDPGCIQRVEAFVNADFERMEYTEAIRRLEASGQKFDFPVHWGMDLQSEHERYLTETLVGRPVVVMNYPKDIKAFYMRMNDDGKTVAAMDVLAPGIGEIIGGSQREERLDVLDRRMVEMHLEPQDYWWYRDLRRYGTVPHAGFGLGFERALMYLSGVDNIREVIPFPRAPRHAEF